MTQNVFTSDSSPFSDAAIIFKVLGHPLRLKVLLLLKNRNCAVNELCEELELEQPAVSQQLTVMRNTGIVAGERRGACMVYSIIHPLARNIASILHTESQVRRRTREHAENLSNC
jgi:ArsR family transcriptional regulator